MHQVQNRCGLCRNYRHHENDCERCSICHKYGHNDDNCSLFYSALREYKLNQIMHENPINFVIPDQCHICYMDTKNVGVITTKCGHTFCEDCILSHYTSENLYSKYCPICNVDLTKPEPNVTTEVPKYIFTTKYLIYILMFIWIVIQLKLCLS